MAKFGIYFAYWADQYNVDYGVFINRAARLGFDSLGVRASGIVEMSREQLSELKKRADDAKIELTYCIGFPAKYDLTSDDAAVRRETVAYATRILEAIHHMKGTILNGVYYSYWLGTLPEGVKDKRPYIDRSLDGMKAISAVAGDCGITCCLEVVNRYETFLLNTAAEAVDYIERLGSPNVKILLDTFHMSIEEESLGGAIAKAGDKLGHFHVAECNRDLPGRGHLAWDEISSALRKINYQGIIELEPFVKMGNQIGRNIRLWRDLSQGADDAQLDRNLAQALDFLRRKLAADG